MGGNRRLNIMWPESRFLLSGPIDWTNNVSQVDHTPCGRKKMTHDCRVSSVTAAHVAPNSNPAVNLVVSAMELRCAHLKAENMRKVAVLDGIMDLMSSVFPEIAQALNDPGDDSVRYQ